MRIQHDQAPVLAPKPKRAGLWWVLAGLVVGFGCVLRFWAIGRESLWFDEGYTAWVMTLSPARVVEVIRHDVSPPLYYLLLKGWVGVFGDSEAALRSLSAVAACVAIPLAGLASWAITRSRAATLVAMLVMSVSVLQVQFAQEARSYGIASLLALGAFYGAMGAARGSRKWLGLWLLCAAGFVHLHNMMWFYLASLSVAYLVMPSSRKLASRLAEVAMVDGLTVLSFAWWIPALLGQMAWLKGNFWAGVPSGADLWQVVAAAGGMKLMHLSRVFKSSGGMLAATLLIAIALLPLITTSRDQRRWALATLLYAIAPIVAVFAYAHLRQSFFVEKIFTASTFAVPMLAGLALSSRWPRVACGVLAGVLMAGGVSTWGYLQWENKEQWREAVAEVNSIPREGTLVVCVANEGEQLYDYYTRRAGVTPHVATGAPQAFLDLDPPRTIQRVLHPADLAKLESRLKAESPQRVVLVLSHVDYSDPQSLTRDLIRSRYRQVRMGRYNWVTVETYEK